MRNRYGEIAWSPGLRAWSGARQSLALGLSLALVAPWRGGGPLALARAFLPPLSLLS